MREKKCFKNVFKWIPMNKRIDRFGPLPPRKPDPGIPLLWLTRNGGELFLVNSTGVNLDSVQSTTFVLITIDDEMPSLIIESDVYSYTDIKPGDAVKVEEFDGYYDLDYSFVITILITSSNLGTVKITTPLETREIGEMVLLWDNGNEGKNVKVIEVEPS